jgi:hypothetical protein
MVFPGELAKPVEIDHQGALVGGYYVPARVQGGADVRQPRLSGSRIELVHSTKIPGFSLLKLTSTLAPGSQMGLRKIAGFSGMSFEVMPMSIKASGDLKIAWKFRLGRNELRTPLSGLVGKRFPDIGRTW